MPPAPAPHTAWLFLIRHGVTELNQCRPPRLQGRTIDAALSADGLEQARQTAAVLAEAHLDAVYCSPLARARQTAEIIAAPHGLGVNTLDDLAEIDVGAWEGRCWDEIAAAWPEAHRLFWDDAAVNPFFGGENLTQVHSRATPVIDRLLAEGQGRVQLVVAHNMVNRAYLAGLLGIPLARYRNLAQDNCGINLLRRRHDETRAIVINSVLHLQ